jgi:hypothetical protein
MQKGDRISNLKNFTKLIKIHINSLAKDYTPDDTYSEKTNEEKEAEMVETNNLILIPVLEKQEKTVMY